MYYQELLSQGKCCRDAQTRCKIRVRAIEIANDTLYVLIYFIAKRLDYTTTHYRKYGILYNKYRLLHG